MSDIYSIRQNQPVSAIKLTVREAAEQWLSSAKLRVKESSYANYTNIVNKHIIPMLGGEFMQNLTTSRLNDFIHHKLNYGRFNGKGGLSAKSVRDIMTVYRSIEAYAAREYGVRETRFTMPKIEKKELELAINLIEQMSEPFKPEKYKDEYNEKLKKAIKRKIAGNEIVEEKEDAEPTKIINLMEALQKSLKAAK